MTPVIYNRSLQSQWQIHKCVGSRLCCREKFQKFITGSVRAEKQQFFQYLAQSQQEEVLLQTDGITASLKVCLLGVTTHQISRTLNVRHVNLKPMTNFGFHKFISSIVLDRNIHRIQRYVYFSHPHKNWADCQKTDSGGIN